MAREILKRDLTLVYGGATVGLMGQIAREVMAGGGRVIGVIPGFLASREIAHNGITELIHVNTMHERKARMESLSDCFAALPGGLGTIEEIFEMLTWVQLGVHSKPCGFLNTQGYYDPILAFLEKASNEKFLSASFREHIHFESSPDALMARLTGHATNRKEGSRQNQITPERM